MASILLQILCWMLDDADLEIFILVHILIQPKIQIMLRRIFDLFQREILVHMEFVQ